jgi:hypothetical protein
LEGPTDKRAQQIYLYDLICAEIEGSKNDAFAAQIINDCYNFEGAEKMLPEETAKFEH